MHLFVFIFMFVFTKSIVCAVCISKQLVQIKLFVTKAKQIKLNIRRQMELHYLKMVIKAVMFLINITAVRCSDGLKCWYGDNHKYNNTYRWLHCSSNLVCVKYKHENSSKVNYDCITQSRCDSMGALCDSCSTPFCNDPCKCSKHLRQWQDVCDCNKPVIQCWKGSTVHVPVPPNNSVGKYPTEVCLREEICAAYYRRSYDKVIYRGCVPSWNCQTDFRMVRKCCSGRLCNSPCSWLPDKNSKLYNCD